MTLKEQRDVCKLVADIKHVLKNWTTEKDEDIANKMADYMSTFMSANLGFDVKVCVKEVKSNGNVEFEIVVPE